MSSLEPSSRNFWILATLVMAGFVSAMALSWPAVTDARHGLEHRLVRQGDREHGLAAVAWYRTARDVAPHDPAVVLRLAPALWGQGSGEEAASVLARYKAPQAVVLRGRYLVRLERFDEAERILRPVEGYVGGGDLDANYWLGVALAEQGKVRQALEVFGRHPANQIFEPNLPFILLQQEMGIGSRIQPFSSPEAIADAYAGQGMIRSAQRVLANNHVTSASSWLLRGQLDQAAVQVNWQEVEADYQQAIAADPTSQEAMRQLRAAARRNGDTAELVRLDQLKQALPQR